ncbi:hypothetical protein ACOMHN_038544 [Nucella lapillus]
MSSSDRSQQGMITRNASPDTTLDKSSPHRLPSESPVQTPGQQYEPHPRVPNDKPYGAALAKILQLGHRVKRCDDEDGRELGTVTAVPSARIATPVSDPSGLVDVRWDSGGEGCYRMGRYSHYDLDLA